MENNKRGRKKRLLIVIAAIFALLIILSVAVSIIESYQERKYNTAKTVRTDYNFYPADYNEDIFEDPEYIDLVKNGYCTFTDYGGSVTLGIDPENPDKLSREARLMSQYVLAIINADINSYNEFHSEDFFRKNEKKTAFTKQKLYNINITAISSEEVETKDGSFMKYKMSLSYEILKNNGTFRNDFLTGYRTQYFILTDKTGELLVDDIYYLN